MTRFLLAMGSRLPDSVVKYFGSNSRTTKLTRPLINRILPQGVKSVMIASGMGKGLKLCVDTRSEKFYWTGLHESHLQTTIRELLQEGDSFWDIGAHIGFFSLIASRLVGPTGIVHAFEPMNENRDRLRESLALNGITNVNVHSEAIADFVGYAILYAHAASLKWSLHERESNAGGQSVACTTIDALTQQLGPPSLIKIDAEGAELDVLRGAKHTINNHSPKLVVEFTDQDRLDRAEKLLPQYEFAHLAANHWSLAPCRNDRPGDA